MKRNSLKAALVMLAEIMFSSRSVFSKSSKNIRPEGQLTAKP